jgi:hypothetical protein
MKAAQDQVLRQTTRVVYTAQSRELLYWYIKTLFFSLITLGFYLPVAANRLLRLLTRRTVVYWYDVVESLEE